VLQQQRELRLQHSFLHVWEKRPKSGKFKEHSGNSWEAFREHLENVREASWEDSKSKGFKLLRFRVYVRSASSPLDGNPSGLEFQHFRVSRF
jgi:hypothetical protein